tara:strand:+ start:77 stop:265 length:189 start_codon:yes stop_codon:yes gene_type:complete
MVQKKTKLKKQPLKELGENENVLRSSTSLKKASVPVKNEVKQLAHEPTRYGDWEKNGRCIDF